MYAREEDIFNAIYRQLKVYVSEHYITDLQYMQQIQKFNDQIIELTQSSEIAWASAMKHYEQYVQGKTGKEALRTALDAAHNAKAVLTKAMEQKEAYEKKYIIFRKFLSASSRHVPITEIIDHIDKIVVDTGREIVVKWNKT